MDLPRPYNSYNLFSQLEREYILQTLLGFAPTVSRAELFDPRNYPDMPPLPPRYDGLVLLWDWHLPGKLERRKRRHRKSHGKIGFRELTQRISQAWSAADDDVRSFCTVLSEIESQKYKKIMKEEKKRQRKIRALKAKASAKKEQKSDFPDFDWTVNVDDFPHDDFALALAGSGCVVESASSAEYSCVVSLNTEYENFPPQVNNGGNLTQVDASDDEIMDVSQIINGGNLSQVDMSDDEIIDVWRSIQSDNEIPTAAVPSLTSPRDEGRTSFVDSRCERFVNLGRELTAKKQRSLPLPTRPRRVTIPAWQA